MAVPTPTIGKSRPTGSNTVGTVVAKSGLSVQEFGGNGIVRKTVFTLTAMAMTMTEISGTAEGFGSQQLYDFPQGRIKVLGCVSSLAFTTTSELATTLNGGSTCSHGIGTTATVAGDAGVLSGTMMNFMPGTGESVKAFTSSATINVAGATALGILAAVSAAQLGAIVNGTVTAADLYLNIAAPTANDIDADATLTVTGTIELTWINEGYGG